MINYINKSFREITDRILRSTSFINLFNILEDEDGNYLLNIFKSYEVSDEATNDPQYYYYYDLDDTSFWENIAYDEYNNERLWWMIPLGNSIINPFESIEAGKTVKIISEDLKYQIFKDMDRIAEE